MGNITELYHHKSANNFTREFTYHDNKLNSIEVGSNTFSFSYDDCGNQIQENSERHFEWDYADRMRLFYNQTSSGTEPSVYTHYLYDAGGNRVKKFTRTSGGNWQSTTYIDGIIEYTEDDSSNLGSISHIMDDSKRIATMRDGYDFGDSTPAIKYNLDDHLGSSNVTVDDTGALVSFEEYYPFGETSFGSYGKKRYRFCGKEKDEESGLYYYGARYYSPWTCRFVSVDPLSSKYPFYTPYQYAGNKPINFIDLDGKEEKPAEGGGKTDNVNPQGGENKNPNSFKTPGGETATFQEKYSASVTTKEGTGTLESGTKVPLEKGVLTDFDVKGTHYNAVYDIHGDGSAKFANYQDKDGNVYDFNKQNPSTKSNVEGQPDKGMDKPFIEKNDVVDKSIGSGGTIASIAESSSEIAKNEIKAYKYAQAGRDVVEDLGKVGKIGKIFGKISSWLGWLAAGYDYATNNADTHTLVDVGVAVISSVLMGVAAFFSLPGLAIGVTIIGLTYGIVSFAGLDEIIDNATNHYGKKIFYPNSTR
jgi:RHS repeat-associated protein